MAKDLVSNLDLNLLKTFLVLMQEKNTRKASARLFVSQPAISQALQRMREHFNDQLFVKVTGGLEPTPFAESLAENITPHWDSLLQAVNNTRPFKPTELDSTLRIALSSITLSCLSGPLFNQVQASAPSAQLELTSWSNNTVEEILFGETLLGVSYALPQSNQNIYSVKLIELTGRVIVRRDHPITKSHATPHDFAGYPIASIITPGWNDHVTLASKFLTDLGVEHSIGFRSELVMAILNVLQHTDMYLPHSNLFPIEDFPHLRAIDFTVNGKPYVTPVYAHMHIKNRHTPLMRWLLRLLQQCLSNQINKSGFSHQ
ncbi:LysR family transcriptional regulator [Vibrio sp. WXL103]|uniref:LysR family transcriptional regulator n=1 Tax=Vibrio sp. WXL103 TaxID=3450710 RepID=UPI003EC7EB7C